MAMCLIPAEEIQTHLDQMWFLFTQIIPVNAPFLFFRMCERQSIPSRIVLINFSRASLAPNCNDSPSKTHLIVPNCPPYSVPISLQQLQMPRDLVYGAPGRRSNTQDRHAPRLDLGPARILDHFRRDALRAGLLLKLEDFVLGLDLEGDLRLAERLPPAKEVCGLRGGRCRAGEGLVACEGCVRALRSDLA